MIAGYNVALFVHRKAAVGVTVERKADIELIIEHELLHLLNMRRAAVDVNINTVGIIGDNIGIGTQSVKHAFGHHPSRTVCTVEADLLALVRASCKRYKKAYVAIAACRVINGAADLFADGIRQAVLFASSGAVNVGLNLVKQLIAHLFALAVYELDAVIVIGIVACRDHYAAVEIVGSGNI